jgi:hypothetical protein
MRLALPSLKASDIRTCGQPPEPRLDHGPRSGPSALRDRRAIEPEACRSLYIVQSKRATDVLRDTRSRSPDHVPVQRTVERWTSALDPVVHVGNTGVALEDPGALELDVLGAEVVEEAAPLAEEHRDEMDLEFV